MGRRESKTLSPEGVDMPQVGTVSGLPEKPPGWFRRHRKKLLRAANGAVLAGSVAAEIKTGNMHSILDVEAQGAAQLSLFMNVVFPQESPESTGAEVIPQPRGTNKKGIGVISTIPRALRSDYAYSLIANASRDVAVTVLPFLTAGYAVSGNIAEAVTTGVTEAVLLYTGRHTMESDKRVRVRKLTTVFRKKSK